MIKDILHLNIDYHHLSLNGSILGVTTSYENYDYRIFDCLVCQKGIILRLKRLGLIVRNYFDDPYVLTDVNNYYEVRVMPKKINIRKRDPDHCARIKAAQDKLEKECSNELKMERICPYCNFPVSTAIRVPLAVIKQYI